MQVGGRSRLKIEYIVKRECTTESKLESKRIAIEFNLKTECETKPLAALGNEKIYFSLKVKSNSSRGRAERCHCHTSAQAMQKARREVKKAGEESLVSVCWSGLSRSYVLPHIRLRSFAVFCG